VARRAIFAAATGPVERTEGSGEMSRAKLLAFYLPQFHPIPENDAWWGPGFTEWTNVVTARPLFRDHYQPHLPADLGFYDLRLPESREAQAGLAQAFGISGFCYYHYWFNGKRLLHRPFDDVLLSGSPKLSFCLCWANENWTRRWDGHDAEVLLAQTHSDEDDACHAEHLLHAFRDDRYIKINGRPLFLVYRTALLRNAARTARIWRDKVRAAGFPDLYLVRVESWGDYTAPQAIGFDAAVEFAPEFIPSSAGYGGFSGIRRRIRNRLVRFRGNHEIFEYESLI
jgi:lipopolysaccharide biosynthesis protein